MPEAVGTYTAAQVRAAEQPLLAAGVPLMARASSALAHVAQEVVDTRGEPGPARVLVLAGSGDNGGDALFAAASLAGADVDVLAVGSRIHEPGLAAAVAAGARRIAPADLPGAASGYDLVLDGILGIGTGADPALRGTARLAVETLLPHVRAGHPRVIAVDLPSGLQPDDGTADGAVLPAFVTVTFGAVKRGLVTGRGPDVTGRLVLVDLGLELPASVGRAAEAEVLRTPLGPRG